MKRQFILCVSVVLLVFIAAPVLAHDYWFAPESFFIPVGASTRVHLYVGDEFKREEERQLQKERTSRFEMLSAKLPPLNLIAAGQDNQTPVAQITFKSAGNPLIVMERKPQQIELAAPKFTDYLTEEGLTKIIAERQQSGESNKPGRERYSRYLKALVQVGDQHDDTYKRVLGQTLEIIPQSNPYNLQRGDVLQVRVLFEGKPLSDVQVSAYNSSEGKIGIQTARTDGDGMAAFKLDKSGDWLVRLVYMRRCAKQCANTDWESFWGAYSFGMK